MRTLSDWVMGMLLLVLVVTAAGCKEVELTFVNTTDEALDLYLTVPATGRTYLGVVSPEGGTFEYEFKIDDELLPATCAWEAGSYTDSFTITEETEEEITITIGPLEDVSSEEATNPPDANAASATSAPTEQVEPTE